MSTIYNGAGQVPFPTSGAWRQVFISASTNASPIHITSLGSHAFNTGDSVEVEGHTVNTNANGQWTITVVDATHFILNGSVGNGVGGATGYCVDYEIQPAYRIPSPGEAASMVTLGPIIEGLANTTPFLYRRCGRFRLHYIEQVAYSSYTSHTPDVWSSTSISSTDYLDTAAVGLQNATPLLNWSPGYGPIVQAGDLIKVTLTTTLFLDWTQSNHCMGGIGLYNASAGAGVNLTDIALAQTFNSANFVPGSGAAYPSMQLPINLTGMMNCPTTGILNVGLLAGNINDRSNGNQGGFTLELLKPYNLLIKVYRTN
jgi:hypothetical protein